MKQSEIVRLCGLGAKLCKSTWTGPTGMPHTAYFLEPGGKTVREDQALRLLDRGLFEPTGDALFEAQNSQSWRLKTE